MTVSLSTLARNGELDAITTALGSSPLLRIYNGSAPATAGTALSGNTKLAELAMSATPFPAASAGVLTANSITTESSADSTGTASFYRLYKSDGTTCVAQGSVGTSASDLNLNTTSIVAGGPVAVTSFTYTAGNV